MDKFIMDRSQEIGNLLIETIKKKYDDAIVLRISSDNLFAFDIAIERPDNYYETYRIMVLNTELRINFR